MAASGAGGKLAYFVAGAGVGAILALLFAPQSGEETRRQIGRRVDDSRDYLSSKGKEFRRAAEDLVDRTRKVADDVISRGKEAVGRA